MPGHRDLIVDVTLGIDVSGLSGKGIRSRSAGRVPDPHRVAAAIERTLRNIPLGDKREFILRETTVSSVVAGFSTIAEIARVATRTSSTPSPRRTTVGRSRRRPTTS